MAERDMSGQYIAEATTKTYKTAHRLHFITITKDVEAFIGKSRVETGTVTIQTHHTTASLWVNEDEKNLIGPHDKLGYCPDIKRVLDRFAEPTEDYGHNDIADARNPNGKRNTHLCDPDENGVINECINAHAHCQGLILQSSVTLIIERGKLVRGRWQEIMLIELDHDRERTITMVAQGVRA